MGKFEGRKIVVAVDGSEVAKEAFRYALDLAQALSCGVTAITAIQTRMPGYRAGYFSFVDRHILKELREFARGVLEEASKVAGERGLEVETIALEADKEIFEQIADYLEGAKEVAFLVMGSYGHSLGDRKILGSTTERLITEVARRGLKVPILVVP